MEFQRTENLPFEVDETKQRRKPGGKVDLKMLVIWRILISAALSLLLAALLSWTMLFTILRGPSDLMRERFVAEASENRATSWLPYLVLPANEIDEILGGND